MFEKNRFEKTRLMETYIDIMPSPYPKNINII